MVFHNEDGNPARANIKQALGSFKDGDGDGDSQLSNKNFTHKIAIMRKVAARVASCSVFIIFMLAGKVASRHLHYDASKMVLGELSDGASKDEESVVRFKGMVSSEKQCEQMYGFLPCSSNLAGNLFLILAYEYLLYHGEYYAGGDGQIFRVFGKNYFVSSFFQLLDFLPESAILLVDHRGHATISVAKGLATLELMANW
ncbi:hypothetical protein Tco_0508180 [Tanacetum coccineum]